MLDLRSLSWLLALALCAGCPTDDDDDTGDDDTAIGDDDDSAVGDDDDSAVGCADTAAGTFPAEAEELAHTPDEGGGEMQDQGWQIAGYEGTYDIGEQRMWEAVRFDLLAPATVYGARVVWGNLTGEGERPVTLGTYPDFGSNGFDFWQWEALWEGDRCLTPDDEGAWVDYVFDEPVEVDIPGLFHIAHLYEQPGDPVFRFDTTTYQECDLYDACHSAWNLPEADPNTYYNGISMIFPYNYSVRLMVQYHDTIPAEDKWFQIDEALSASSRVAWGDYDNDGWDDLMTNGPTLYRNNGDGTFTDVSADAGLDDVLDGSGGGVWGDYDNDGCLDYFGQGTGYTTIDILLRNECDGTFTDVTLEAGIHDIQDNVECDATAEEERSPTEGAAWIDLDSDGYIDLYMANHNCWDTYVHYPDRFWHNEGDGTFVEWADEHGFTGMMLAGRGVSPVDVDQDQDVDIFVSNYVLNRNLAYENLGDGEVADRAVGWNLAGEGVNVGGWTTYYGHTIGSAWIDLENDGDWDLIQANLAHPRYYDFSDKTMVLRNDGDENFEDVAVDAGIHYRETHSNPTVADFDSDGDWDLFVTCVYDGRFSELYLNDGTGAFTQVNYESGAIVHNGWGSAAADYDNDGDVDLVAYDLFRNDTAAAGNHWLQVRPLGGVTANRAAIGAQVQVDVGGQTTMHHVSGGSGTGCQDSMVLSFGLGAAAEADAIRVYYPGGAMVTVDGPIAADQRVWVHEDGTVSYGWTP